MVSVLALSVIFGATLPLLSLRDIFPRPGEVFPQRERTWQPVCAKRKREIYKKAQNRVRSGAKCGIL